MSDPVLPFQPDNGSGVALNPAGASQVIAVVAGCRQVLVTNTGTTALNVVIFEPGQTVRAANATDAAVPPGRDRVFSKSNDAVAGAVFGAATATGVAISGNGN